MIDAPRRDALEAALSVVRFVADQDHQPVALGARLLERARDQGLADAAIAEWRLDRERPEQQRLGLADADRRKPTEPTKSVPMRAVNDRSRLCATCSRRR